MTIPSFKDFLEAFVFKVNSKGEKRKKLSCPPGYQPSPDGTTCVPMTGEHKHNLKVGAMHGVRDKKAQGDTLKRKTLVKTRKANRYRTMFGL